MPRQRWIDSRDADDFFEDAAERRDGYGERDPDEDDGRTYADPRDERDERLFED